MESRLLVAHVYRLIESYNPDFPTRGPIVSSPEVPAVVWAQGDAPAILLTQLSDGKVKAIDFKGKSK